MEKNTSHSRLNSINALKGCIYTKPYNVIHLPSAFLGCFFMTNLFLLQPLLQSLLGSLLIGLITLLKYLVIAAGIVVIGKILLSDKSPVIMQSTSGVKFREDITVDDDRENRQAGQPIKNSNGLFYNVNYNAYESFIRRAE